MDNRRQQIVINKKFQFHYAIIVVAMTIFLANMVILFQSLLPSDRVLEMSSTQAWTIGLIELMLVIGVWYGSLKSSHKVAGLIFVITRQLKAVGAGDLWARISLRERDMFQEEAAAINESLDQLGARVEAVQVAAETVRQAQASGKDASTQMEKLFSELATLRLSKED